MLHISKKGGFTLIEVLVALVILVSVAGAVTALSNSIVGGTIKSSDNTVAANWAAEGQNIVSQIISDNIIQAHKVNDQQVWFEPALSSAEYGWYKLTKNAGGNWQMSLINSQNSQTTTTHISPLDIFRTANDNQPLGETLTSGQIEAVRYICIEAIGANFHTAGPVDGYYCNHADSTTIVNDGDRNRDWTSETDCISQDKFCQLTSGLINKDKQAGTAKIITPPGNAVKVTVMLVWPSRDIVQTYFLSTIQTNWRGYEQVSI